MAADTPGAAGSRRPRTVACPQCGATVEWRPENRFRPFCSERCRLIDLGAWATEDYRVPEHVKPMDESGE
ncbi:MAG: DNA gyrase inhibitor YacG [Proteobacteria bacterium]|nr:DNA gyrase inhibitor YacG [Burkholderiales bacterium]